MIFFLNICFDTFAMDDTEFLHQFMTQALDFKDWTHAAHVRMAYLVMKENQGLGIQDMYHKISDLIRKYNAVNKELVKTGFHATITWFWVSVVYQRVTSACYSDFEEFVRENQDLLGFSLIFNHYHHDVLFSQDAKTNIVKSNKIHN